MYPKPDSTSKMRTRKALDGRTEPNPILSILLNVLRADGQNNLRMSCIHTYHVLYAVIIKAVTFAAREREWEAKDIDFTVG